MTGDMRGQTDLKAIKVEMMGPGSELPISSGIDMLTMR